MPQPRRTLVIYPPGDTVLVLIDVFAHGHQITQGRGRFDAWIAELLREEFAREARAPA